MSEGKWINALAGRRPKGDWHPIPAPRKGRARDLWAKEMVKREPYGLTLEIFRNSNYVKIGGKVCRRDRKGGVWHMRFHRKLLTAETIQLLYLKVVELLDTENEERITRGNVFRPIQCPNFPPRYKSSRMDPEPPLILPQMNLKSTYLPSDVFYRRNRK